MRNVRAAPYCHQRAHSTRAHSFRSRFCLGPRCAALKAGDGAAGQEPHCGPCTYMVNGRITLRNANREFQMPFEYDFCTTWPVRVLHRPAHRTAQLPVVSLDPQGTSQNLRRLLDALFFHLPQRLRKAFAGWRVCPGPQGRPPGRIPPPLD